MEKYTPEAARRAKGISQNNMAKFLGLCTNSYIRKEKGIRRFYVDEACKFCEIVEIPIEKIIFFK